MKYLAVWSPGLQNIFWKISKTLQPPFYMLNVHSLMSSFAMLLRLLRAPIVLNQMSFVCSFVFVKIFSISNKVCLQSSKNDSALVLLQKKRFSHNYFYLNIHKNMFYHNRGHTRTSCQHHEIYETWSWPKLTVFLQRLPD